MNIKSFFNILIFIFIFQVTNAQSTKPDISKPDATKKVQTVELSCGECKFNMKGQSCDLAVRINGKAYFLDGAGIDSFGDAHAKDGFCKAIRKAEVQGEIIGNRFSATYIKLLPQKK